MLQLLGIKSPKGKGCPTFSKNEQIGHSPLMCGFNPIWWSITCFFTSLPDRFQILILSSFIFWEKKCIMSTNKACVLHQLIFLLKKSDGLIIAPRHKILYTYTWSSKLSMHFILKGMIEFKFRHSLFLSLYFWSLLSAIMWKTNLHSLEPLKKTMIFKDLHQVLNFLFLFVR